MRSAFGFPTAEVEAMMLTTEEAVRRLQAQRSFLADEFGVRRVGLFGSYAKGCADVNSDIDLVIEFERPIGLRFVELVEYLERLLGRRVDALTLAGLESIRAQDVARDIAQSVRYV